MGGCGASLRSPTSSPGRFSVRGSFFSTESGTVASRGGAGSWCLWHSAVATVRRSRPSSCPGEQEGRSAVAALLRSLTTWRVHYGWYLLVSSDHTRWRRWRPSSAGVPGFLAAVQPWGFAAKLCPWRSPWRCRSVRSARSSAGVGMLFLVWWRNWGRGSAASHLGLAWMFLAPANDLAAAGSGAAILHAGHDRLGRASTLRRSRASPAS